MTNIINYSVAKTIPLTIIAVVNNMGPLVTVVLAFIILKERLKCFEIMMICLTVGGVFVVILFANPQESSSTTS